MVKRRILVADDVSVLRSVSASPRGSGLEAVWGKEYVEEHDLLRTNVDRLARKLGRIRTLGLTA